MDILSTQSNLPQEDLTIHSSEKESPSHQVDKRGLSHLLIIVGVKFRQNTSLQEKG